MVRAVVGEVDKSLARHASPITALAKPFRHCIPPEEGGRLFRVWRIRMILGWIVFDFANIVPGTWIKNVTESGDFALTKQWKQGLSNFE